MSHSSCRIQRRQSVDEQKDIAVNSIDAMESGAMESELDC